MTNTRSGAGRRNPRSGYAYFVRIHGNNVSERMRDVEAQVRARGERRLAAMAPLSLPSCRCGGPVVGGRCAWRFSWRGCAAA